MPDKSISLEIKPLESFGGVTFGMSMEEVECFFGKPAEVEKMGSEAEAYQSVVWHYWEEGFSLFFDDIDQKHFTCVELDNPEAILWGEKIFLMKEEDLVSLFKKHGCEKLEIEEEEWGERRIGFDDLLVDLYFEEDQLVAVNFGVFIEEKKFVIFPN